MQILGLLLSFAIFTSCIGAPVQELFPRATNLEITLRETYRGNKDRWHFALIIHPAGVPFDGKKYNLLEHILNKETKCLEMYDKLREAPITTSQAKEETTTALLPAKGETTNKALSDAAEQIARSIPPSKVTPEGYQNCLDFAVTTVHRLMDNGYVSAEGYKKFEEFKTKYGKAVYDLTSPGVFETCKRGLGGACQMKKGAKKAAKPTKPTKPTKAGQN